MNKRDTALDFAKGALVVGMAVYHSINYGLRSAQALRYISFITGAFIFLSGFVVSHIYLARKGKERSNVAERLFIRSIKLVVIFILLNIGIQLISSSHRGGAWMFTPQWFLEDGYAVFIAGHARMASFDILLPIAYLLAAASTLARIEREKYQLTSILVVALIMLSVCSILYYDNIQGYNMRYVTIGFIGTACGFMPNSSLRNIIGSNMGSICVFLAIYLLVIMKFKLYYPLYVVYVIAAVVMFYMIGMHLRSDGYLMRRISQLGEYSLLSYIAQIAILQLFYKVVLIPLPWGQVLVSSALTTVILIILASTLDESRKNNVIVDRLYNFVFR